MTRLTRRQFNKTATALGAAAVPTALAAGRILGANERIRLLCATVLRIGRSSGRWNFACMLKGDPRPHATRFQVGPWQNRNLFKALAHAIQHHFHTAKAPYPVERTLLVSGVLDASMHSRAKKGEALKTPTWSLLIQLAISRPCVKWERAGRS